MTSTNPPRSYADIEAIPPEWAWVGRLPLKEVVIVVGEEGIGKSFMGSSWVACITQGAPWPDGSEGLEGPASVLMVTPEDDPNSAMAYRLRAAGADLSRVFDFTTEMQQGWVDALKREMLRRGDIRFVWIDPLSAVSPIPITSSNTRVRREIINPLRDVLREVAETCAKCKHPHENKAGCPKCKCRSKSLLPTATCVAIVHTTKQGRTSGSKAITEAARMVLKVSRLHVAEQGDVRLIHVQKTNVADDRIGDIAYTIGGRWPDVRVQYFEPDPSAVAYDPRPTPLRRRITELLSGSEPMTAHEVWEHLRDGYDNYETAEHVDGTPDLKYQNVRTSLTRLGQDPYSGVYPTGIDSKWAVRRDDGPIVGLRPLPDVSTEGDNRSPSA